MPKVEKSVFISYRRTNFPWARAIYEHLRNAGYDVFMDLETINSGSFERITLANIRARAHFIVILTPSAMDRTENEDDWLRKEIREAINTRRNIIPLFIEGFDFYAVPDLPDDIDVIREYNGLKIYAEYFDPAMTRLREGFLNIALEEVVQPARLSNAVKKLTEQRQQEVNALPKVEPEQLTAQAWFERSYQAYQDKKLEETIEYCQKAIKLDPKHSYAYTGLGVALSDTGRMEEAEQAYHTAIELDPKSADAYYNLACLKSLQNEIEEAYDLLEKAMDRGQDPVWTWQDPDFENLRKDRARFERIVGPEPKK